MVPLHGAICTEETQPHMQRHAEYIYHEYHHINTFQITLNVPGNLQKLNPCYKTLVRTLTVPLHATYVPRNYNIIPKNMQNIYTMNITTWNTSQINLNVGENLQKLNPCYKILVRTRTAPLHVHYLLRNYIIIVRKTCRTYIPWIPPHEIFLK